MASISITPFGPQHPSLLEPIHLKLRIEEEEVVGADIVIGYNHRGLERAMELDFKRNIFLSERVCGICSFHHSTTYVQAIEQMAGLQIPTRAKLIRTVMLELQRMTSHMLTIGHIAEVMGYENLFMQTWRERESVMSLIDRISGNRVHYSMNTIGGIRKDIGYDKTKDIESTLSQLLRKLEAIRKVFAKDSTFRKRTVGVGVLSRDAAVRYGAVGPTARASDVPYDVRLSSYAGYGVEGIRFRPIHREEGDCYARTMVRVEELFQSVDLIQQSIGLLRDEPVAIAFKGNPQGEAFSRVEAPRGELFYYVKAKGEVKLDRVKIRTPTFVNVQCLAEMIPHCQLADVPVIAVSIDPCICCTDR
ncbi:MAG: nickel-dependent hydrogenase large subunit [Thermoplasmata archaeon]|jgi:ech hydrogenase subunit E